MKVICNATLGGVKNSLFPLNKLGTETEDINVGKINKCSMESKVFSKSAENRIPSILFSSVHCSKSVIKRIDLPIYLPFYICCLIKNVFHSRSKCFRCNFCVHVY